MNRWWRTACAMLLLGLALVAPARAEISGSYVTTAIFGNGATVSWGYGYPIFAPADLSVVLKDASGNLVAVTLDGAGTYDYAIAGTFDPDLGEYVSGVTVTFNTAPPAGYTGTIGPDVPQTQPAVFDPYGPLPAKALEGVLDRQTVNLQQMQAALASALSSGLPVCPNDTVLGNFSGGSAAPDCEASLSVASIILGTPLVVSSGGTGASTLTAHSLVASEDTAAFRAIPPLGIDCLYYSFASTVDPLCTNAFAGTFEFAGTITLDNLPVWPSQTSHRFWVSPSSTSGIPTFRAIVGTDLPNPSASTLGGIESFAAVTHQWLRSISTAGVPAASQPTVADLAAVAGSTVLGNPPGSSAAPVAIGAQVSRTIAAVSNTTGTTLSAANLFGGMINRSGESAAATDTTDTAANIVAAIPGAIVGSTFLTEIQNTGAYKVTLAGGTGVTITGQAAIAPLHGILVMWTATNVTGGTQAVTGYTIAARQPFGRTSVGDAAYAILASDLMVQTSATLTTARSWTLPLAANVISGTEILIDDGFGGVSATNTLTVALAGSDTMEGGTVPAILNGPKSWLRLRSDGVSNWAVAGRSVKVTQWLSSGNYTPEPGMKQVEIYLLGGGGAGGGGARQAASTACSGGGAGGGGSTGYGKFMPAQIGASATVTIAAAQTGGAGATVDSTAGSNGSAGNITTFTNASAVVIVVGRGGGGGAGGQLAAAAGGGGGASLSNGGSSTSATAGTASNGAGAGGGSGSSGGSATNPDAGAGGGGSNNGGTGTSGGTVFGYGGSGAGGGGGITAGNVAENGLGGGQASGLNNPQVSGGAGGTAGGSVNGTNGGNPGTSATPYATGSGGGGGASDLTTAGNGGNGGYGAGGGGGGSTQNTHTAGTGGQGGQGLAVTIEYF